MINIKNYLIQQKDITEKNAEKMIGELSLHQDIFLEFTHFINNNEKFLDDSIALSIQGYTAKRLCESTYLKGIGAYMYMVYLKEEPVEAIKELKRGLPKR